MIRDWSLIMGRGGGYEKGGGAKYFLAMVKGGAHKVLG